MTYYRQCNARNACSIVLTIGEKYLRIRYSLKNIKPNSVVKKSTCENVRIRIVQMWINLSTSKLFRLIVVFILLVQIFNVNASLQTVNDDDSEDVIDVAVRLTRGNQDTLIADLIAEERELINGGLVDGINLYHFQLRRKRNQRSKRSVDETIQDLQHDERISFAQVAESLERQKRELLSSDDLIDSIREVQFKIQDHTFTKMQGSISFNDLLYPKQWYLVNQGQLNTPPLHDINIAVAWSAGYTGKGVVICIVDDGLDHPHPDLARRYLPQYSYDLNDLNDPEHDPLPRTSDGKNSHGTRCAGAAVGEANNEMCGVGSAYEANIAGIRILDGRVTTLLEARALTLFVEDVDIKSASWGPTDDGTKMEKPHGFVQTALDYAVEKGRRGKGTILVWASGNGGAAGDDCGADGYVSHQNVISVGSINHLGQTTYFSEYCPSTMAVAYTGGRHSIFGNEKPLPVAVVAADVGGKCTTTFFGTSGAAPVAAGVFALVLEANPELTYRDVMYIIARTARIPNLSETQGWTINGAGYHVNDRFGFGVLDAGQMVALAQNWTNVPPRYECYHEYQGDNRHLGIDTTVEIPIDVDGCTNVTSMEHVVANISFRFHYRGDVKITLISPSKTSSEMLSYRKRDANTEGINYFPFLSVHHWGESPIGRWTLRMETRLPQTPKSMESANSQGDTGEITYFGLRIYGTTLENNVNKRDQRLARKPSLREIEYIYYQELAARKSSNIMSKRDYENSLLERQSSQRKKSEMPNEDQSFFGLFRRTFGF